jgi:hypothetical protein
MDGITLQEMSDETVQQLHANYVRQPAFAHTEGTAADYAVTLEPAPTSLVDGFGITIVPHVANADNPTLNINGLGDIALKDQKGNPYVAGKLQIGKPYTFRKVGTDFLADSSGGSGDAVAGDIRAGKTATTDNGDVVGTLPVRTGSTVTPSTVNQTKQAGIYDNDIVVQGSSNLVAGNIKKGTNMFGVVGTYEGKSVGTMSSAEYLYVPVSSTVSVPTPSTMDFVYGCRYGFSSSLAVGMYDSNNNQGQSCSIHNGRDVVRILINLSGACSIQNNADSSIAGYYIITGRNKV